MLDFVKWKFLVSVLQYTSLSLVALRTFLVPPQSLSPFIAFTSLLTSLLSNSDNEGPALSATLCSH